MKIRAAAFLAVFTLLAGGCRERSLDAVEAGIRQKFSDVPRVTTGELAREMEADKAPVLLDVRTPPEYAVSHLRHARQVDPAAGADAVDDLPKDTPVVTYCSVGYRSAALARRLRAAGFTDVRNLEGSIFQWANEGRPVYRDGQSVGQVHPYDATWGKLLKPDLRAEP